MAAEPTELHPAVQFLKDNAVVVGLVVLVVASVGVFAAFQAASTEPAAKASPTVSASAVIETPGAGAAASPTAATGSTGGSTDPSQSPDGAQAGAQPAPSESTRVLGTGQQSVTAKDWKPYAKEFAAAWINTADGKEAWLKRLKPLTSPGLYAGFEVTDIRAVPSDTFDSVSLAEESPGFKTFHAYFENANGPLFDGRVQVQPDGSWLVDQIGTPKK